MAKRRHYSSRVTDVRPYGLQDYERGEGRALSNDREGYRRDGLRGDMREERMLDNVSDFQRSGMRTDYEGEERRRNSLSDDFRHERNRRPYSGPSSESDRISESRVSVANLPQYSVYKAWPKGGYYEDFGLDDTIKGVNDQMNEDGAKMKRFLQMGKY